MGNPRLDNPLNKSDIAEKTKAARQKAKWSNAWAEGRSLVNTETGEILTDDEGNALTLADLSRSWYSKRGARNNARVITKRFKKAFDHPADVKRYRPKFITLTPPSDTAESWQAERAIQKFTDAMRKWAKRHGADTLAYFWTAEVQKRGALHYHVLALGLPFVPKKRLRSWWPYGFVKIKACDDMGRGFKYLAKYLWKWGKLAGDPGDLPDWWFYFSIFSKRRYGFSNWFSLEPLERVPRWLKDFLEEQGISEDLVQARREPGGGWYIKLVMADGIVEFWMPSLYRVIERGE